jgi:hypothetical protein
MKYFLIALFMLSGSYNVMASDCNGLSAPLDELKYLDETELQMKICAVPKSQSLYMEMFKLGDLSAMDEISACSKVTNLSSKVLKKEYGVEPYSKEQCKKEFPDMVD